MKRYIYCLFIGISCLLSCSSAGDSEKSRELGIPIGLSKNHYVSIYDFFSKIEVIPLETNGNSLLNFPLGEPERIIIDQQKIYLLDEKQQAVFIFDTQGSFLQKIDKRGSGPEEYYTLGDFGINRFTGNIELLSVLGRYINVYDSSGNHLIEKIRLPEEVSVPHRFHNVTPDIYVFFSGAQGGEIYFYSKNEEKIIHTSYEFPRWLGPTPFAPHKTPFYIYGDSLFFTQTYNGDVFYIDPEKLQLIPHYRWDFGRHNFDLSILPENESLMTYVELSRKISMEYAILFLVYKENDSHYFTRFKFKNKHKHLIWNKNTHDYLLFDKFKEGVECLPLWLDNEVMYTCLSPSVLHMAVNPSILDEENLRKYKSIREDDNPVLVKYTFK